MVPGEEILMEIKAPREIHGSTRITNRWQRLGFVAGVCVCLRDTQ